MKTILIDAVHTFVIPEQGIDKDMFALLESYDTRKIILTNADDEQIEKFGLDTMPYDVFTMKHSPNKPDPLYYQTCLATFALTPDDVVYAEHNQQAVVSARSVGIVSYRYDHTERNLEALQTFLNDHV